MNLVETNSGVASTCMGEDKCATPFPGPVNMGATFNRTGPTSNSFTSLSNVQLCYLIEINNLLIISYSLQIQFGELREKF